MKLSILIATYNTRELLLRCLGSIHKHLSGMEYEIIVFDNGSQDGTSEAVRDRFPATRLLRHPENIFYFAAQNRNAAKARGQYLLLLNSDIFFTRDGITPLVEFMESNIDENRDRVAAVQGLILDENLRPTPTGAGTPELADIFLETLPLAIRDKLRTFAARNDFRLKAWDRSEPRKVDILCDAFLLLRRETFLKTGGYDPRFRLYWGDADLSLRLGRLGELWHRPEAVAVHSLGATLAILDPRLRDRILAMDEARFVRKYFGSPAAAGVYAARLLGQSLGTLKRNWPQID